jgi:hypothetical protein
MCIIYPKCLEEQMFHTSFGKNCQKETQISRENLKVFDRKMLIPRYHLKPLEYLLHMSLPKSLVKRPQLTGRQNSEVNNSQEIRSNSEAPTYASPNPLSILYDPSLICCNYFSSFFYLGIH